MSDKQIIEALIARDEQVTKQFFFKDCRSLFISIIRKVFSYNVDYEEFVNELYIHLMENDAYRLRQYAGRSSIYQWLKVTAIRYFIAKRDNVIDMGRKVPLTSNGEQECSTEVENKTTAVMDIESLVSRMSNYRYVHVIRRLVLQEAEPIEVAEELKINVDNLYNIKKRAIAALTDIALKDIEKYEEKNSK